MLYELQSVKDCQVSESEKKRLSCFFFSNFIAGLWLRAHREPEQQKNRSMQRRMEETHGKSSNKETSTPGGITLDGRFLVRNGNVSLFKYFKSVLPMLASCSFVLAASVTLCGRAVAALLCRRQ